MKFPPVSHILVLCLGLTSCLATEGKEDPWQPFRALEGRWTGKGSGFGVTSDLVHEWRFTLQEKFLKLETRSETRSQENKPEVHEDVGYLSFDSDRGVFVFRQFLSEGFVNTFDVSVTKAGKQRIDFSFVDSESAGGMRVRMQIQFVSDAEYEMVLELAKKDGAFAPCQRMTLHKSDSMKKAGPGAADNPGDAERARKPA